MILDCRKYGESSRENISCIMKETRGKRFNSNLGYGYRASTKPTGKIIPLPEKSNLPKNPVKPKVQPQGVPLRRKVRQRNEDQTLSHILTIGGGYYLFSMAFKIFNNFSSTFKSGKDFGRPKSLKWRRNPTSKSLKR